MPGAGYRGYSVDTRYGLVNNDILENQRNGNAGFPGPVRPFTQEEYNQGNAYINRGGQGQSHHGHRRNNRHFEHSQIFNGADTSSQVHLNNSQASVGPTGNQQTFPRAPPLGPRAERQLYQDGMRRNPDTQAPYGVQSSRVPTQNINQNRFQQLEAGQQYTAINPRYRTIRSSGNTAVDSAEYNMFGIRYPAAAENTHPVRQLPIRPHQQERGARDRYRPQVTLPSISNSEYAEYSDEMNGQPAPTDSIGMNGDAFAGQSIHHNELRAPNQNFITALAASRGEDSGRFVRGGMSQNIRSSSGNVPRGQATGVEY